MSSIGGEPLINSAIEHAHLETMLDQVSIPQE